MKVGKSHKEARNKKQHDNNLNEKHKQSKMETETKLKPNKNQHNTE